LVHAVGFLDEAGKSRTGEAFGCVLFIKAAGKCHFNIVPDSLNFAEYYMPIHVWHCRVEQNSQYLVSVVPEGLNALSAIAGSEHGKTGFEQHCLAYNSNKFLVVDD